MLSDLGHLLSDVDYLLFHYVLYTSYIFPFSFSLFQVHVFSYSYSSFHFHLFSSLPSHISHSLFPYVYLLWYLFVHSRLNISLPFLLLHLLSILQFIYFLFFFLYQFFRVFLRPCPFPLPHRHPPDSSTALYLRTSGSAIALM